MEEDYDVGCAILFFILMFVVIPFTIVRCNGREEREAARLEEVNNSKINYIYVVNSDTDKCILKSTTRIGYHYSTRKFESYSEGNRDRYWLDKDRNKVKITLAENQTFIIVPFKIEKYE